MFPISIHKFDYIGAMNYFDLYGLPVSLQVDQALLKKKFYSLSRQYHPDFHAHLSEQEQAGILEQSSIVNKAYKTLSDEDETMRYVLQLKDMVEADEKYQLDPEFLMEVMDINEELMELELDEGQEQLIDVGHKANALMLKIEEDVTTVVETYQDGTVTEEELLQVKDFYYKKKYLRRILDRINGIRNIASPQ